MKRLWLFFPENDIALAHGNSNFTAPAAAMTLRRAGSMLPVWMASDGDYVLCDGVNDAWLSDIQSRYGVRADVWNHTDYDCAPTPWGWSAASRKVFENSGFPAEALPTDETLDRYRMLSHRRTAAALAAMLHETMPHVKTGAVEADSIDVLKQVLCDGAPHVIKSPWSSSGRGVHFVTPDRVDQALRQAEGTIRRQGSVMVEPMVDDRLDFAMLYYMESCSACYRGLSVFHTDVATEKYTGNIVASQDILAGAISHRVGRQMLTMLDTAIRHALDSLLGGIYRGPVGVDLMADTDGYIHVAEINLRYTMGFLSLSLERLVPTGEIYIYEIIPGDRVPGGAIRLTPPSAVMQFVLRPA